MFRENESDVWTPAKVLSHAGKAWGRNASWFNVQTFDNGLCVNLEEMDVKLNNYKDRIHIAWSHALCFVRIKSRVTFEFESKLRAINNISRSLSEYPKCLNIPTCQVV